MWTAFTMFKFVRGLAKRVPNRPDGQPKSEDTVHAPPEALMAPSAATSSSLLFPPDRAQAPTEPMSSDDGDDQARHEEIDMEFVRVAAAEELQTVIRGKLARKSVTQLRQSIDLRRQEEKERKKQEGSKR